MHAPKFLVPSKSMVAQSFLSARWFDPSMSGPTQWASILGAKVRRVNALPAKLTFNPPPNRLAGSGSTSEYTPKDRECLVNVRPLFVSNPQPPELIRPSESPFD